MTGNIFSLKGALAGLGASLVIRDFVQTAASFEGLAVSMNTLTGDAGKAREAVSWIREFTRRTPYELDQVTSAYQRLLAYGLDPARYLGTLGDTASAHEQDP